MNKVRVLSVFGTRPEAIKMCPLALELAARPEFESMVCVTAQHREMLDSVLDSFGVRPDFDLDLMEPEQTLASLTGRILRELGAALREARPDVVLVHGDTTTTFAGALSAFYEKIPVGHVEAGLRTFDRWSPYPEEMNRSLVGRIAEYHFAPTASNRANLEREAVQGRIFVTGNTVIDALHLVVDKISSDTSLRQELAEVLRQSGYDINRLNDTQRRLVLITGHRRENFGEGFLHICTAIKDLSMKYPNVDFVYPMHLNPNVRRPIAKIFEGNEQLTINSQSVNEKFPNMFFAEPLEYLSFVYLMEKAYIVLTDSGGIQEEAPGLGKPVLVMRDTTERPEAVAAGTVKLVGTDYDAIVSNVSELLDSLHTYEQMSKAVNPYGDGKACQRIINVLKSKHTCE